MGAEILDKDLQVARKKHAFLTDVEVPLILAESVFATDRGIHWANEDEKYRFIRYEQTVRIMRVNTPAFDEELMFSARANRVRPWDQQGLAMMTVLAGKHGARALACFTKAFTGRIIKVDDCSDADIPNFWLKEDEHISIADKAMPSTVLEQAEQGDHAAICCVFDVGTEELLGRIVAIPTGRVERLVQSLARDGDGSLARQVFDQIADKHTNGFLVTFGTWFFASVKVLGFEALVAAILIPAGIIGVELEWRKIGSPFSAPVSTWNITGVLLVVAILVAVSPAVIGFIDGLDKRRQARRLERFVVLLSKQIRERCQSKQNERTPQSPGIDYLFPTSG